MSDPALLPCPFCGGTDLKVFDNSVDCKSCGSTGPDLGLCVGEKCRPEAIAGWNRRTPKTYTGAEVQAMVAAALGDAAEEADRQYSNGELCNPGYWIRALIRPDARAELTRLHAKDYAADKLAEIYWRLRSYAVHDDDCTFNRHPHYRGCSCGLKDALDNGEATIRFFQTAPDTPTFIAQSLSTPPAPPLSQRCPNDPT
jgi:hypothetical protein